MSFALLRLSDVQKDTEGAKQLAEAFDLVVVPDDCYASALQVMVGVAEDKMYALNENGKRIWTKGNLSAERSYSWVDRIIIIDESKGRTVIDDLDYSTWDSTGWSPMTVTEHQKIISDL